MVSLNRAAQCIGRRIQHTGKPEVKGHVEKVSTHDVWIRENDGSLTPCIPENMEWVSVLSDEMWEAIEDSRHYETPQVFYDPYLYMSESDEYTDYDENLPGLAVIGSSAMANDNNDNHPLFIIAAHMRRVYPVRINAAPDMAWELEERLGWVEP